MISKRKEYILANNSKRHDFITSRVWWIALLGLIIVVVASTLIFWVNYSDSHTIKQDNSKNNNQTVNKEKEISANLNKTVTNDGAKAGQDYLDSELTKTTSAELQAKIYIEKSSLSASTAGGDNTTQAIEYALKAESLSKTPESAITVAVLEEKAGNIQQAIDYYQLYIDRVSKNPPSEPSEDDRDYYSQRIIELEAELK